MPTYDYNCNNCGTIEVFHPMTDDPLEICPECDKPGLFRLISAGGGVIIKGREVNQFSDVKYAKFWRDKNGVRHKVTSADGHSKAATVSKQTKTPEEVKAIKKQVSKQRSKLRSKQSYARYRQRIKKKYDA